MVAAHVVNWVFQGWLYQFGLVPRQFSALPGIYISPFLHGNLGHLLNNLLGLFIFSSLLFLHSLRRYLWSSLFIITVSGLLVWLFGRSAMHIGASGWVFGLWSLTMATAWFDRKLLNVLIALGVAFFYGGMLWGVLPTDSGVSFESHLFGALAGIGCAFVQYRLLKKS
jgi:membrane associated rhomboid family serine protease